MVAETGKAEDYPVRMDSEEQNAALVPDSDDVIWRVPAPLQKTGQSDFRVFRIQDQLSIRCSRKLTAGIPVKTHFRFGAVAHAPGDAGFIDKDLIMRDQTKRGEIPTEINLVLGIIVRSELLRKETRCAFRAEKLISAASEFIPALKPLQNKNSEYRDS
tara:strand:- start:1464 stop:1940 length:477 start_codon:yes stop_codon:yes gene_type:complete